MDTEDSVNKKSRNNYSREQTMQSPPSHQVMTKESQKKDYKQKTELQNNGIYNIHTRNHKLKGGSHSLNILSIKNKTGSTMITQGKSTTFNMGPSVQIARSGSRKSSQERQPVPLVKKFKVTRTSNLNDSQNKDNYGIGVYQSPYSPKNSSKYGTALAYASVRKKGNFHTNESPEEQETMIKQYQGMFRNCLKQKRREEVKMSKERKKYCASRESSQTMRTAPFQRNQSRAFAALNHQHAQSDTVVAVFNSKGGVSSLLKQPAPRDTNASATMKSLLNESKHAEPQFRHRSNQRIKTFEPGDQIGASFQILGSRSNTRQVFDGQRKSQPQNPVYQQTKNYFRKIQPIFAKANLVGTLNSHDSPAKTYQKNNNCSHFSLCHNQY